MKSESHGKNTSPVEVVNISKHGFWLSLSGQELFLPFDDFPWFRNASVGDLSHVQILGADHLYWPDLDVDLSVESIRHPEKFPLVSESTPDYQDSKVPSKPTKKGKLKS
jgi:hypothetical protein